jgi:hypothetical protein
MSIKYLPKPNKCYGSGVAFDSQIGCEVTSGWGAVPEYGVSACPGAECTEGIYEDGLLTGVSS